MMSKGQFDTSEKRQRLISTRPVGQHLCAKIYHDRMTKVLWFVINLELPGKRVKELYRAHVGDRGHALGLDDHEVAFIAPHLMDKIEFQVVARQLDLMEDAAKADKDYRFDERDYLN